MSSNCDSKAAENNTQNDGNFQKNNPNRSIVRVGSRKSEV